jgi:hypothetical protein
MFSKKFLDFTVHTANEKNPKIHQRFAKQKKYATLEVQNLNTKYPD